MPTFCLAVSRTPSPPLWPLTSADGEKTRRYSKGSSKRDPSSKRTSSSREEVRNLTSVGCGISKDLGYSPDLWHSKELRHQRIYRDRSSSFTSSPRLLSTYSRLT